MPHTVDQEKRGIPLSGAQLVNLEVYIDRRVEKALDAVFNRHIEELKKLIAEGYPDGSSVIHRAWHEEQIAMLKSRRAFYENLRNKTAAGLVWAALAGLGTLILLGLKNVFHVS